MERGEVWWINFSPPKGRRPAIIVTRSVVLNSRASVTVIPVTRTIRNIPTEIELDEEDGLPQKCIANADDIMTINKNSIGNYICKLTDEKMLQVKESMIYAFDLS